METPPSQTITRVTKTRVKDPVKQQAGRLGAAIRTHNLKQKLLNDIESRKLEKVTQQATPVKAEEPNTDWTMLAIAAATDAGIIVFLNLIKPKSEAAKQKNDVPPLPVQAQTHDVFYMA